jgi:two-component sensor histidine kinase
MNMEDLYRLLRSSHVQAQGIVDTVAEPLLVLDQSLCVKTASRSFFETFKVERYETIGRPLHELGNGQWNIPELRRLLEDVIPKATAVINFRVEHEFPELGTRTMLVTARTLHHPDNGSHSMLVSIVDATEQMDELASKDMLFGELRHRMKNLMAVTQSIARQTATKGRSAEEYRDDLLGRLSTLTEAQELSFAKADKADLNTIFDRILAPYSATQEAIVIEVGPVVDLGSQAITSLSLVTHELATNAAKYGALSQPGGRVRIGWKVADGRLSLSWVESDGPKVTEPTKAGYGTRLIHHAIRSLEGKVEQRYGPEGLQMEIVIPLQSSALAG